MKGCSKCCILKEPIEFSICKRNKKDGLRSCCKSCDKEYYTVNKISVLEYRNAHKTEKKLYNKTYKSNKKHSTATYNKNYKNINKEKIKQYSKTFGNLATKRYYRANIQKVAERSKLYYDRNKESILARGKIYSKNNADKANLRTSKRRAIKIQATPKWLSIKDWNNILFFYTEAKRLEKLDGVKRHVDHIIPLQGKTVCGLHVPWNLQVLSIEENLRKGNKLTI